MMEGALHAVRHAMAALALLALAACSGSPATTLLTLDPVAPPASAIHPDYQGPAIVVPAVHVPAILDRAEFVHQVSAGAAKVDDFARWAAPLGILTRDTLVRDLTTRLPEGAVLPPGTPATKGIITIDVTILSFDASGDGATMQIAYGIGLRGRTRQVSLHAPSATSDPVSAARAYADLIAKLADKIAGQVAGLD